VLPAPRVQDGLTISPSPFRKQADSRAPTDHIPDNGVIERLFRTLKEQIVYGRIFQTVDNVRDVRTFAARYNAEWLIEKNGHQSPDDARAAWHDQPFRRTA
jgi:hypothetical protein